LYDEEIRAEVPGFFLINVLMLNSLDSIGKGSEMGNSPRRILILCTGNICRSPVAECMFKKLLSDSPSFFVFSAGLAAPLGVKPHPFAIKTALGRGYCVDEHKVSRNVTSADVVSSDLILVMEQRQRTLLTTKFSSTAPKTFLMGQWDQIEIADPIGRPEIFFAEIAEQLENAAIAWSHRLRTLAIRDC
jgi:protein-tyrosine phosphatase